MPLSLANSQIKSVAGVDSGDTTLDDVFEAIQEELQPVLEASIQPEALSDAALTPLLALAFSEVISGEHFARQCRANALFETVSIGPLKISPPANYLDPTGLIARGYARLRPYLKPEAFTGSGTVRTGGTS